MSTASVYTEQVGVLNVAPMAVKAFDKITGEEFDISKGQKVATHIYSPLSNIFQQRSELLKSIAERYEDDVSAYDRAVGSKSLSNRLKIEFLERWARQDKELIQLVNDHHATLKVERNVKYV